MDRMHQRCRQDLNAFALSEFGLWSQNVIWEVAHRPEELSINLLLALARHLKQYFWDILEMSDDHLISKFKHLQVLHLPPDLHAVLEGHWVDELQRFQNYHGVEWDQLVEVGEDLVQIDQDTAIAILFLYFGILGEIIQKLSDYQKLQKIAFFFVAWADVMGITWEARTRFKVSQECEGFSLIWCSAEIIYYNFNH